MMMVYKGRPIRYLRFEFVHSWISTQFTLLDAGPTLTSLHPLPQDVRRLQVKGKAD